MLGFAPVPAETSDEEVCDDAQQALTRVPLLASPGNNLSLESSPKPNKEASSIMSTMLQEGVALGSSPEKRRSVLCLEAGERGREGEG